MDSAVWPGRLERREANLAELDDIPVGERREPVLGLRRRAQIDGGASPVAQFQMAGNEVGMKVREEHVRDAQAVLPRHTRHTGRRRAADRRRRPYATLRRR